MDDDIFDRHGARRYNPLNTLGEWRDVHAELPLYKQLSHSQGSFRAPVLAAFDPETFAVWGNAALASAIRIAEQRHRKLRDEDIETLVHEFARTLEYEDLFEDCRDRNHLREMIRSRLLVTVARASEESFMNKQLRQERLAEEMVQQVRMELLSSFDIAAKGRGLRPSEISNQAEDRATQWIDDLRGDYRARARDNYRRLVNSETARAHETNGNANNLDVLSLHRIARLFPTDHSYSLATLVRTISEADLVVVVPARNEQATLERANVN